MEALAQFGVMSEPIRNVLVKLRDLQQTDYAPPPFISGDDLTAAGLTPGPVFKRALDDAYDAQLEGRVTTKEQAMDLGLRIAREQSKAD